MIDPDDKKIFASLLVVCSEMYPKAALGEVAIGVWWEALRDYPIEEVKRAFIKHLRSPDVGQFMPKPADIVRMIEGTSIDGSMQAWAKLDTAVRAVGPYSSVCFDDALIHRCVEEMGGWIALCGKTDDEWPFIGNEFRTRYKGYRSRAELPDYPRRLIGITAAWNQRAGFQSEDDEHFAVAFIGDASKAEQVQAGGRDGASLGIRRVENFSARLLQVQQEVLTHERR